MKIILIFALIGAVLYAIDMLICKISPKAGYIVAIFNLPFLPVGIITFILTQKYLEKTLGVSDVTQYFRESGESTKQKKKKGKSSANISKKAAEVQANKRIELVIPIGTTENKKPNGKLYFHDEGKKFIDVKHSLKNLTDDCDICVYSLTPKGETSPKWLIVKVTQAGCMDRYLDNKEQFPECCVIMEKFDYEKSSPMNLFSKVKELTYIVRSNIKRLKKEAFYVENGLFEDELNANDFFSIEVDSNSKEPGAEIYLRDKEHFLSNDEKPEVTEPQTPVEAISNKENVKMSYSSKGILSIVDRKGRYMGMQNIAEGFLTKRCIHISTQGPEDNPTAVIITVYDKEDAGKNFEDINFSALKAEYDRNATPSMFSMMLSRATANFDYDKEYNNGTCYRFYRNGRSQDISLETFMNPDNDYSKPLAEWE